MKLPKRKETKLSTEEYCTLLFGANIILLLLALSRFFEPYITIILIAMTGIVIANYVNVWRVLDELA